MPKEIRALGPPASQIVAPCACVVQSYAYVPRHGSARRVRHGSPAAALKHEGGSVVGLWVDAKQCDPMHCFLECLEVFRVQEVVPLAGLMCRFDGGVGALSLWVFGFGSADHRAGYRGELVLLIWSYFEYSAWWEFSA